MSVVVPTSYTELRGVKIRPGAPIVDDDWETISQNLHHLYARGSERQPVFWGSGGISTTSTSYVQPEPLDAITAVWRPTRVTDFDYRRHTVHVYGVDADVRATLFDPTVGTNATVDTLEVSCGSTPEWATESFRVVDADAVDGSGDPIPLALSFELKTSATTAEVYQIHVVSQILTAATMP